MIFMPELIKPKRTYRVGSKVFLTPEFREKVRANRKRLEEDDNVYLMLNDWKKYGDAFETGFWINNGHSGRFWGVFTRILNNRPIDFLKKLKKSNPKIMILGPSKGEYILDLHDELKKENITPETDVLGLTSTIMPEIKQIVKQEYNGLSFEELWNYPEKYKSIIRDFLGKYDLIEASYSTGYHTNYPEKTSFYTALMLAPQGEAYVLIRPESVSSLGNKFNKFNKEYKLPFGIPHHGQKITILYIKDYLQRAVKAYNKKYGTNLEFELNIIDKKDGDFYLIIKRIN